MTPPTARLREAGPAIALRAFLGVTFTFAGLQKLANPSFFNAASPTSFQAQIHGAMGVSPIGAVLRLTLHAPVLVAIVIAVAEVLVGLGTLAGFLARIAAAGGALLSLSFFLSISYGASPYYYGSDIVFFFAWTVLILGGSGPLSLDAVIAAAAKRASSPTTTRIHSRTGSPVARRTVLGRGVVTAAGLVGAGALIGADVGIGRAANHNRPAPRADRPTSTTSTTAPPATTSPTTTAPPPPTAPPTANSGSGTSGTSPTTTTTTADAGGSGGSGTAKHGQKIAATGSIALGSAFAFTDPQSGPAFVVHDAPGHFVGFSAICTHAGCTVNFDGTGEQFVCPCHGSIYNAKTGAVENGPAMLPLPSIALDVTGGEIYLKGS